MTFSQAKDALVAAYMEKAGRALASMNRELDAGECDQAVSRAYFACFYAVSAVLVRDGHKFVKHTGVRSALHLHLIRTGRVPAEMGRLYDELFAGRGKADYDLASGFGSTEAHELAEQAEKFVKLLRGLPG
jgi:uncharacterized protein (UPF0332 family)